MHSNISSQKLIEYDKYKIPPDFNLAKLHAQSCKLYQNDERHSQIQCGCCQQYIGAKKISICSYVSKLRLVGQEVPLFFNFMTLMLTLSILVLFLKAGEYLFLCEKCEDNYYSANDIDGFNFSIFLGFMDSSSQSHFKVMLELILYSIGILLIKVNLKSKKYEYASENLLLEKRAIQLINLPPQCSKADIQMLFKQYSIDVTFAYRVRQYRKQMKKAARLKKFLYYIRSEMSRISDGQYNIIQQKYLHIQKKLEELIINRQTKKLDTAFVVFNSVQQKNKAFRQHYYNPISKAFLKLFTCCSNNAIKGKHVSLLPAPSPDDIRWENLQSPYYQTKIFRFLSIVVCAGAVSFGLISEVIVFNKENNFIDTSESIKQFYSSIVIFVINFLIINFLEVSTNKIESHQSNTRIKLSLIKKITFYMFFNVSISPFLIMLYNQYFNQTPFIKIFDSVSLTLIIICVGNLLKPFLTLFSVPRFLKWFSCTLEKAKGKKSKLYQIQANQLFQPPQFPIEVFYSLLHASLMMSFFYLGTFQFLIVIEIPSIIFMYFIAKWMLLRVCKKPSGLSVKLNNLAQSLMRFYVPLYWLGRNSILVTKFADDERDTARVVRFYIYQNVFQSVSAGIVVFNLFCEPLVTGLGKFISKKNKKESLIGQGQGQIEIENINRRNYQEANLFFNIHDENLMQISRRETQRGKKPIRRF